MGDLCIYRGSPLVLTTSRLEIGDKSKFLHSLLSSQQLCDGSRETTTLIFPEEDETENSLRVVFRPLLYWTRQPRYSILRSKELAVMSLPSALLYRQVQRVTPP